MKEESVKGVCPNCHSTEYKIMRDGVVRCAGCRLVVYPYKRMTNEAHRLHLDMVNETLSRENYEITRVRNFESAHYFDKLDKSTRILEVGASSGDFLQFLMSKGFTRAVGIEPLQLLVDIAQSNNIDITRCLFSFEEIKRLFTPGSFDLLIFREVFYYFPDLDDVFRSIHYLLSPGGHIYIKNHSISSYYYMFGKNYLSRYGPGACSLTNIRTLKKILRHRGASIIWTCRFGGSNNIICGSNMIIRIANKMLRECLDALLILFGKEDRFLIIAKLP